MRKYLVALVAVLVSFESSAFALSLTLQNASEWEIHELYFSPADEEDWGPDQLGEEVIEQNDKFTLNKIPKGKYDVKIVDEDADSCIVHDVDFTSSELFVITDKILLGCVSATSDAEEE